MSRRSILKVGVGAALASAITSSRSVRADARPPLRLVLLMQANGTSQEAFWPDASGSSRILDPLLSHVRLRERTVVVKGLVNADGGAGNQHDQGFAGLYTGKQTIGTFADPWGAGPSIDQMLAPDLIGQVPFPTLNCGVLALDTPLLKDHRRSFSYVDARMQIPTETDPTRLFTKLFGAAGDAVTDKSVLDFASRDLARMSATLCKDEREKLDLHATAIREYEQRLTMLATRPTTGQCAPTRAPLRGVDPRRARNVPQLLPAMIDLVALAIGCDLARIVTFPIGNAGLTWRYEWLGIDKDSHADIAHKDDGKTPAITEEIVQIGRWHAEHVARLALALDAMPSQGGGTVLDDTLIVWGNELATGQHALENIPAVLIGGRVKTKGFVDRGHQPYQRLGCTILRAMGQDAPGFGDAPTCGPIRGVEI
jgi:hypothetical protein